MFLRLTIPRSSICLPQIFPHPEDAIWFLSSLPPNLEKFDFHEDYPPFEVLLFQASTLLVLTRKSDIPYLSWTSCHVRRWYSRANILEKLSPICKCPTRFCYASSPFFVVERRRCHFWVHQSVLFPFSKVCFKSIFSFALNSAFCSVPFSFWTLENRQSWQLPDGLEKILQT